MVPRTIDYDSFIATVRDAAGVSDEEAERVACATLQTLTERITTGEAEDLAEKLPDPLRACALPDGRPERFDLGEFLRRVAHRANVGEQAERDVRGVFAALFSAVGPDEFADMRAQLPKDFDPLLDAALREAPPPFESAAAVTYDNLVDRVAQRLDADEARARVALDAVLEALARRITGGQVDDLEAVLPRELRPALERGRARSGGRAVPLTLDAFLGAITDAGGIDQGAAAEAARAVFAALRETIPDKEFRDTLAQLPGEYRPLLVTD
jgi:uncharacterized protein (DUF2267 family)